MRWRGWFWAAALIAGAAFAVRAGAQLPADAVMLDKVKIPEKIKSEDLCPVYLEPSAPDGPTWEYQGVGYRGAKPDAREKFFQDPDGYAAKHAEKRYIDNFVQAMSIIWCPVTDEVSPGGLAAWTALGIKWEACCEFCESQVTDQDFEGALDRLIERARISYRLTGGIYTEGASSPVEGAVKGIAKIDGEGAAPAAATEPDEPAYLAGRTLKPTYAEGIGLIFENRCVECHRPGGLAPMSFASLGEIKKWTKSLKETIVNRAMPPWPAEPGIGRFANDRRLTRQEIDLLVQWIEAGYPPGEGQYAPSRTAAEAWTIGEPDHVFQLPEATVGENVVGEVQTFSLETAWDEDRWVVAAEVRLGDEFTILGVEAGPLGAFYPGARVVRHLPGTGRLLKAGEKVPVHVHYLKEAGYSITDPGTKIAVRFAEDAAAIRSPILSHRMTPGEFAIPAGAADFQITARFELPQASRIVSLTPILMQRGKSVLFRAILPDGKHQPLLSIPHWDPNWKLHYQLAEPPVLPEGAVIEMTAVYDNSKLNVRNPNPDVAVSSDPSGESAEGWIDYVLEPAD